MDEKLSSLYSFLGLSRSANPEEIRHAYHLAARRLHPDVNTGAGETELFLNVQQAYEMLSDPQKRAAYDATLPEANPAAHPVFVRITYSRAALLHLDEPQLVYALLEFSPASAAGGNTSSRRTPLNLALVLDRSTSMQGARMDAVKAAAGELVRQLQPEDLLSVVAFSDRAEILVTGAQKIDWASVETKIRMIQPSGGTEIYRGLSAGYFEIRRQLSKERVNHLILLTDGRTYGDEKACLKLAAQAAAAGVRISGIGFGSEWNDTFIDELCSRTGGSADFLARPADLKGYLSKKFQGLRQVYANQVTLKLDFRPGVELRAVYRTQPEPAPLAATSPLILGSIPRDGNLSVLLEFTVQPVPTEIQKLSLLAAVATFQIPSNQTQAAPIWIELERPLAKKTNPGERPPQEILQAVSQLTCCRMQDQARQEVEAGDIDGGTRRLQGLATNLLAGGNQALAKAILMEAEHLQANQKYSDEGEKRIKYETRALLLPDRSKRRPDVRMS